MAQMTVPFAIDATGSIATTNDPLTVARQRMLTYIATTPGERVMRPTFGTPLLDLVFEPMGALAVETIRQEVAAALARDVPEVSLTNFVVTGNGNSGAVGQDGVLNISISYGQAIGSAVGQIDTTNVTVGGQ